MLNNATLQYSSWEDMPGEYQAFFMQVMGNQYQRGRSFYELFFYWFNIAHECGHILRAVYGTRAASPWTEEVAASEFAVAYWRTFGEHARLAELRDCLEDAVRLLPNPISPDLDPAVFFDEQYETIARNLPDHAYLRFRWALDSLEKTMDMLTALRAWITPEAQPAPAIPVRFYPEISVDLPLLIIPDLRGMVERWGISLPSVEIVQSFSPQLQFVSFG